MKERSIIFSGQMAQAILDGKKTQTRRIVKQNLDESGWIIDKFDGDIPIFIQDIKSQKLCPYGQVGDRLWVRETFVLESTRDYTDEISVGSLIEQNIPYKTVDDELDGSYLLIPHYRATEPEPNIVPDDADDFDDRTRWHPSIFMPRWASRITLEITKIQVERLQKIYSYDKYGQKLDLGAWQEGFRCPNPLAAFIEYWESINAKRGYGWDKNPWVWVIEFKKINKEKE